MEKQVWEHSIQLEPGLLAEIRKSKGMVKAIQEYMHTYPGSIDLTCFICLEELTKTFRLYPAPSVENHRGEGTCTRCGTPYLLCHFIPIGNEKYIRLEYFHTTFDSEQIEKLQKLWSLSDDKKDFWRNVTIMCNEERAK